MSLILPKQLYHEKDSVVFRFENKIWFSKSYVNCIYLKKNPLQNKAKCICVQGGTGIRIISV